MEQALVFSWHPLLCHSLVCSEKPSTVDRRQTCQLYKCATQQKLNSSAKAKYTIFTLTNVIFALQIMKAI